GGVLNVSPFGRGVHPAPLNSCSMCASAKTREERYIVTNSLTYVMMNRQQDIVIHRCHGFCMEESHVNFRRIAHRIRCLSHVPTVQDSAGMHSRVNHGSRHTLPPLRRPSPFRTSSIRWSASRSFFADGDRHSPFFAKRHEPTPPHVRFIPHQDT